MSARYWVLASDELMRSDPQWPHGLRRTDVMEFRSVGIPVDKGTSWYLFEDDDAPPELDGQKVELTFRTVDGIVSIASRELAR